MRIAVVCVDRGVPVFGTKGSSVHVRAVAGTLRALGHDVTLLATRAGGAPPARLADLPFVELPALAGGAEAPSPSAIAALDGAVDEALGRLAPLDLVYERHALWSTAGMRFARRHGVPGVLEVNAPLVEEQRRFRRLIDPAAADAAAERSFRAASTIIAVSPAVAAHVVSRGADPRRVHVVPNGVDVERFAGLAPPARGPACTVGFVGTLKPWHGVELLIDAVASLDEGDAPVRLVVVGDGPQRGDLEARARDLGIASRVHFAGSVDAEEIPRRLETMDIAVAPYPALDRFYFSPLKLMEYMAAGRAIVASAIGEIPAVLEEGRCGVLVPPGDAVALASAIAWLRDAPERQRALGAAARNAAERHHGWDAVVGRILAAARSDAALHPPRQPPSAARALLPSEGAA